MEGRGLIVLEGVSHVSEFSFSTLCLSSPAGMWECPREAKPGPVLGNDAFHQGRLLTLVLAH